MHDAIVAAVTATYTLTTDEDQVWTLLLELSPQFNRAAQWIRVRIWLSVMLTIKLEIY